MQYELFAKTELELCRNSIKLQFFNFPKNDNERLFNAQFNYLVFGSQKAWHELWIISYKVAERLIVKYCSEHQQYFEHEELTEKTLITCEYFLRRYKTRNNYYVKWNFIKAIKDATKHAILYKTKLDKNTGRFDAAIKSHKCYIEGELLQ